MSNIFGQLWDNTAGGLLWKPIKRATGLTDAQMALIAGGAVAAPFVAPAAMAGGAGTAATGAAAAPAATTAAGATTAAAPAAGWEAYAKPAMTAMQGASMAQGLLANHSQPVQAAPIQHEQANFAGLLTPDTTAQDAEKRKQQQLAVMQGLLGGYRG